IGSVANYLAEFGWKRGLATHFDVKAPTGTSERAELLAPDIMPTFSAADMVARGARLPEAALATDSLLALIELQNGTSAPSYFAGTTNFYALTRYNWSSYYAMAVVALGEAVADRNRRNG
ncbi:MAG: lytic murein transglycosylase, partial [Caldimonas sp.]